METKLNFSVAFFLILSLFNFSEAANFRNDLPHVRVIEIRPAVSTKLEVGETELVIEKAPNSNIIIGEDVFATSKLVLECNAWYPVQWVYNGDGMPEYSTNTTATKTPDEHTRPDPVFIASISLGFGRQIGAQDSGKYTCRSLQNPDLSAYYYLYVTDENLFTNPGGEEIYYKPTDRSVRIPCSVSNPKAVVSLQKSVNGLVQCPLNESITYDTTNGFELKVSSYFDPAGVYVCTAGYNNTFQVVRYTLVPEINKGPQNIQAEGCQKNDDCPSNQACILDKNVYACSSPCSHICGRNTQCETVNHVPRCYCLPGYRGDAYKACFPNVPTTIPDRVEKDPCTPNPCGQSTQCERIGSTARCSCAPGYQGDPYVRCYQKDVCSGNPCGLNSLCSYRNGYASCTCRPGYHGQPPYCRAECETDNHCATDRTCVYGRCRNPCDGACQQFAQTECRVIRRQAVCARIQTRCPPGYYGRDCTSIYTKTEASAPVDDSESRKSVSPCLPFPCGQKAECLVKSIKNSELNRTSQVALCQCPPKLTGNADVECYPMEEQLARNDSEEIGNFESTTIAEVLNSTDECRPECAINAECSTEKNVCSCRKNYQGNPYMKCTPVFCKAVDDCETPNATCVYGKCYETGSVTEVKSCGINAISIVSDDGKSVCSCPAEYTGIASIECHVINNDETKMEVNGTDLSTTRPSNRNPCGNNTKIITGEGGIAVCECIKPFEGNPWIGCELNCTKNADCPLDQLCYDISHKCVDPCHPNYQPFFTKCGRDAKCKVNEKHEPYCYCPDSHPHGSPHLHCKEKSWMPNHRVSNSTCENKNSLKCGENTACKRFHDSNEYCVCLPGFFGDPIEDQGCKLGLQCRRDVQCRNEEECINGKCLNACRKQPCGSLAGCKAENHKAHCTCHIGTIQNPQGECVPVTGALAQSYCFTDHLKTLSDL